MKKFIFKIITLTVALTVASAVLETGLRLAFPFYHPGRQIVFKYAADYPGTAFGPRNSTIRQRTPKGDYDLNVFFNRHGLRDDKDLASASDGDILVVGDSFSFGWGVEPVERFSDRLQTLVGRRVFNAAIPGDLKAYQGMLNYARDQGARADFIVVGICMNNDLKNYNRNDKFQPAVFGDRQPWKARLRSQLQARSALYLFLSYELQRMPSLRRIFEKVGVSRDINELTLQNIYNEEVLDSSRDEILNMVEPFMPDRHVALIIPSMAAWMGENREQERRIHAAFVERIRAANIKALDMLPILDSLERPIECYFESDPHWNARGHEIAARQLAVFLKAP